jgi:hypothetical protein
MARRALPGLGAAPQQSVSFRQSLASRFACARLQKLLGNDVDFVPQFPSHVHSLKASRPFGFCRLQLSPHSFKR